MFEKNVRSFLFSNAIQTIFNMPRSFLRSTKGNYKINSIIISNSGHNRSERFSYTEYNNQL